MERKHRESFHPETWQNLIKNARRIGEDIKKKTSDTLETLHKYTNALFKDNELLFIKVDDKCNIIDGRHLVFGVDSSEGGFQRVGGFLIVPLAAAYIKYNVLLKQCNSLYANYGKEIITKMPRLHDGIAPSVARHKAELEMLNMENNILEKIIDENIDTLSSNELRSKDIWVYVDGPIIDPPNLILRGERETEFMEKRAILINALIERNVHTIGYVKRIMGTMWFDYISEKYGIDREVASYFHNDWSMVTIILSTALAEIYSYIDKEQSVIVFTKPHPVKDFNYNLFNEVGTSIYYSYVVFSHSRYRSIIGRVDIAVKNNTSIDKVYELLEKTIVFTFSQIPYGFKYPLPVYLAHIACNIPRREARKLVMETLGKAVFESFRTEPNLVKTITDLLEAQ